MLILWQVSSNSHTQKAFLMLHPEIIYIMAHNRKLGGLFMTLELLAFARNGSVITGCFVCSESLESSPPLCGV